MVKISLDEMPDPRSELKLKGHNTFAKGTIAMKLKVKRYKASHPRELDRKLKGTNTVRILR